MEVDAMASWKTTFLYKQWGFHGVFHFHVMCSSERIDGRSTCGCLRRARPRPPNVRGPCQVLLASGTASMRRLEIRPKQVFFFHVTVDDVKECKPTGKKDSDTYELDHLQGSVPSRLHKPSNTLRFHRPFLRLVAPKRLLTSNHY